MSALAPYVAEPEIIDRQAAGFVRLLVLPNPFTTERRSYQIPAGRTLREIVADLGLWDWQDAMVAIDGSPIEPKWWPYVRARADHLVTVRVVPRGGGGGSGNKGWIQVAAGVLLIIVGVVIGIAFAWTGIGAVIGVGLITAGAGLVIGGALTLIFPPPAVPRVKAGAGPDAPVFSITGSRNTANPYGAIPRLYGRHKIFPNYGSRPYTEIIGNDQYLRMHFVAGYGPLALEQFQIGDTPIAEYDDWEMEVRQGYLGDPPLTLFTNSVLEEPLSLSLSRDFSTTPPTEPAPVRTTNGAVDEWSVDWVHPQGLFHIDADGQVVAVSAHIKIWYRVSGEVTWILASDQRYTARSTQPLRRSFRQTGLTRNVYEVKMQQTEPGGTLGSTGLGSVTTGAMWAVLRSVRYTDPFTLDGFCEIALRIKATDQLNGVIDQFNCIATSILPDWDSPTQAWIERPTSNPASVYRDILQGRANARPLADTRLDLAALQAWHEDCTATGRTFSFVVEQQTTVAELLRQVTAVGRATLGSIDGTFGVVRDIPQSVPVQHFTPRNSRDFRGTKLFRDIPHALKVKFINPNANWEIDEVFVYDDGFHAGNATKFESIQFFGVTDADQAYKLGRYHFASARLRPEAYEFVTDVEHLVCTRGDLVRLTHDVPLFGIKSGRITSVTLNGLGEATAITVDEVLTMEAGVQYDVRIRRPNAASVRADVTTVVGDTQTLTFPTPLAVASIPAEDDLFSFGVVQQQSVEVIVTRIEMLRDLGARITCVDAAPAIHTADAGPIPPHDPQITLPPELRRPPAPLIFGLASEGTLVSRAPDSTIGSQISVQWVMPSSENLEAATMQGAWRDSGIDGGPWTGGPAGILAEANVMRIGPLTPGRTVDIRLRSVSKFGVPSEWVTIILIELPSPPRAIIYSLEAIVGGYLARIERRLGPPPPPKVTGLRLVNSITGSPNDTDFAGVEAKFTWNAVALFTGLGDDEDDLTQDTEIRDYPFHIVSEGVVRHQGAVAVPGFVYGWEHNLEDHAGVPAREFTIRVWARSQDGQLSPIAAELTVQNPEPDMSQILPLITAGPSSAIIDWSAYVTSDHDLDHFDVYVDTVNPPDTITPTVTRDALNRDALISGLTPGVAYFVQIVPSDAFGPGEGSQIASVTPTSSESIDWFQRSFRPEDIVFSAPADGNTVSWTAGRLAWSLDGVTDNAVDIVAGSAPLVGGILHVYWIIGEGLFRTTAVGSETFGQDRIPIAVYKGGANLTLLWGQEMFDGGDAIIPGTIGAAALVTDQAIIRHVAQIDNLIVRNQHVQDIAADKLTAGTVQAQLVLVPASPNGKIIAGNAAGARVELNNAGVNGVDANGKTVFLLQHSQTPTIRIGRTIADGATTPPLELSGSGDLTQIVAEQIQANTVSRFARRPASNLENLSSGTNPNPEVVVATMSNALFTRRTTDQILIIWRIQIGASKDATTSGTLTITWRVRRGTTTGGEEIARLVKTWPATADLGITFTAEPVFEIHMPNLANTTHSFVITAHMTNEPGVEVVTDINHSLTLQCTSA